MDINKKLNRIYKEYLQYEHYEIDSDFELNVTKDWIVKALSEINNGYECILEELINCLIKVNLEDVMGGHHLGYLFKDE